MFGFLLIFFPVSGLGQSHQLFCPYSVGGHALDFVLWVTVFKGAQMTGGTIL